MESASVGYWRECGARIDKVECDESWKVKGIVVKCKHICVVAGYLMRVSVVGVTMWRERWRFWLGRGWCRSWPGGRFRKGCRRWRRSEWGRSRRSKGNARRGRQVHARSCRQATAKWRWLGCCGGFAHRRCLESSSKGSNRRRLCLGSVGGVVNGTKRWPQRDWCRSRPRASLPTGRSHSRICNICVRRCTCACGLGIWSGRCLMVDSSEMFCMVETVFGLKVGVRDVGWGSWCLDGAAVIGGKSHDWVPCVVFSKSELLGSRIESVSVMRQRREWEWSPVKKP